MDDLLKSSTYKFDEIIFTKDVQKSKINCRPMTSQRGKSMGNFDCIIKNKNLHCEDIKSNKREIEKVLKKLNEDIKYQDTVESVKERRNYELPGLLMATPKKENKAIILKHRKKTLSVNFNSNTNTQAKTNMKSSVCSSLDLSQINKQGSQLFQELKGLQVPSVNPKASLFKTAPKIERINLTAKDKQNFLNIYRKGIPSNFIKEKKVCVEEKKKAYSLYNTRHAINQYLNENTRKMNINQILSTEYRAVNEHRVKFTKNALVSMNKEINLNYAHPFQLVEPKEFTKDYQICHDVINIDIDEELQKMINKRVKKFHLRNEVNKEIESRNFFTKIGTNFIILIEKHKEIVSKWKRNIITAAIHFKSMGLTIKEFYSMKHKVEVPFKNDYSYELIQAVKDGDLNIVKELLRVNKYLVYDYDHVSIIFN